MVSNPLHCMPPNPCAPCAPCAHAPMHTCTVLMHAQDHACLPFTLTNTPYLMHGSHAPFPPCATGPPASWAVRLHGKTPSGHSPHTPQSPYPASTLQAQVPLRQLGSYQSGSIMSQPSH